MAGKFLTLLCCCLIGISCVSKNEKEAVYIYAAISTSRVLNDFEKSFEESHPDIDLRINFASSSTLARQIDAGAPANIFVSADTLWTAYLQSRKFGGSLRSRVASNSMVLVSGRNEKGTAHSILSQSKSISVAEMEHVPAGRYAKEALACMGLLGNLNGKVIPAMNVRIAYLNVQNKVIESGLVYRSEASEATNHSISVFELEPECKQEAIFESMDLFTGGNRNQYSDLVYQELISIKTKVIWLRHGFGE